MATTKTLRGTTHPRALTPKETLRLAEVALEAGVSYSTAVGWRKRAGFPAPVRTKGRQVWFDRAEVDAFLRANHLGVNYEANRPHRGGRRRADHNTAAAKAYAAGRDAAARGGINPWLLSTASGAIGLGLGLLIAALV